MALAGKKLTFEEYLSLSDTGFEGRAELIDGVLLELPPESGSNTDVTGFMFAALLSMSIPITCLKMYVCEVQVPVLRAKDAANRYPDLVVLRPEHIPLTRDRMTITLTMPPPRWVMEVVSPGKTSHDRDYHRKQEQYAAVGIAEYVIVDPQAQMVTVFQLESTGYAETGRYQGEAIVQFSEFRDLNLTARQILTAGSN